MSDFNAFYKGLFESRDPFDNYIDQYSENGKKVHKAKIIALLRSNIQQKYLEGLEATLAVADLNGVDLDYSDILLELLAQKWHTRHEDIVMLLEEVEDPKSVPILYETALS
ncbi:hypothetical protein [Spirosoma foliorum]|uniref:Uncharacterized protein n=1 Tax=Spirosoma foliorum TaxID=2710596 RepID=A0A7G5H0W2_9BACT|nr:hypothetical protein [Spirosoma foliorum]QMW04754.1 hypothetical protein H3H32_07465 [Spirosoma foliorum]